MIFIIVFDCFVLEVIKFSVLDYLLKFIDLEELMCVVEKVEVNFDK